MTHRLLALAADQLYIATDLGTVICLNEHLGSPVWAAWYDSDATPSTEPGSNNRQHHPATCLIAGGVVAVAPHDYDQVLAYDAEWGTPLWQRSVQDRSAGLLGSAHGLLLLAGRGLTAWDLHTGRQRWRLRYEDPPGFGAGLGSIADRSVYWTTREELLVVDLQTGQPQLRIPLKLWFGPDPRRKFAGDGSSLAAGPS